MMLVLMYIFYCEYCEIAKDYNPECQTLMRVMNLCMMLILVYVLYYAAIVRQQKITFLNLNESIKFLHDVSSNVCILLCMYYEAIKFYNLEP
jgi:hypothetical protein